MNLHVFLIVFLNCLFINLIKATCYEYCPSGYDYEYPVCVSNGKCIKELPNLCYLGVENCRAAYNCGNQWYELPCEYCDCPTQCAYTYDPVCGFNGDYMQLFASSCSLEEIECLTEEEWEIVDFFQCHINDYGVGLPELFCTLEYAPICGYDGNEYRTFGNQCELDRENYENGYIWGIIHSYGECPQCLCHYEYK